MTYVRGVPAAHWSPIVLLTLSGCLCGGSEPPRPPPTEPVRVRAVTQSDFGEKWPLKVASGRLECVRSKGGALYFHSFGKTWGLNGKAIGRGATSIDEVAKTQVIAGETFPVDVGVLIRAARELCSENGASTAR